MPLKRIKTPQYIKPTFKKEKRIKIPQPVERPIRLISRSIINWLEIQKSPDWHVLHRRGIYRPRVGIDPLEARAVPKEQVRGTLPERIIYKYLIDNFPGLEFDFQSSLSGGRLELGGIVADFIFPKFMLVLQVQGPTHNDFLRARKDEEQFMILKQMGYEVYPIWEDEIYDEYKLENIMRSLLLHQRVPNVPSYGNKGINIHDTLNYDEELQGLILFATNIDKKIEVLVRETY